MVSTTISLKPLRPETAIVEFPIEPTLIEVGDAGPEEMVKSTTLKITWMVCSRDPLLPLIPRV